MNFAIPATSTSLPFFNAMLARGLVIVPDMELTAAGGVVLGLYGPNTQEAFSRLLDLERYGYQYDADLLRAFSWLPVPVLAQIHRNVIQTLRDMIGEAPMIAPLYPNFPKQVISARETELLLNATVHYLGASYGFELLPAYDVLKRARLKSKDLPKPKMLRLGTSSDVHDLAVGLFSANISLALHKREALISLLDMLPEDALVAVLGESCPQRETLAMVGGWLLQHRPKHFALLAERFNTATSILRLLQSAGTKQVWLIQDLAQPKYGSVSRAARRTLLGLLDSLPYAQALSDMVPYREAWVRAGEVLHPGEYAGRFPAAYGLITSLRNKQLPRTFAGELDACLAESPVPVQRLIGLLQQRPGVFARRLLEAWRKLPAVDRPQLTSAFLSVAESVDTPVLLQLRHRVLQIARGTAAVRGFLPKGGATMWVAESPKADQLSPAEADVLLFEIEEVLLSKYASYPALGKVYVDPRLAGYTLPFGQRTAQKALHTLARGSRIPLPVEQSIVRAFLWWNEQGVTAKGLPYSVDRVDLDLSCLLLDAQFRVVGHCSYWNLRGPGLTHSGDVVMAPNGACEYLDIDVSKLASNVAYVALAVFSYTMQNFADLPEAHVGWMSRKEAMAGEIFDARTVKQKIDLTLAGNQGLIGVIDVSARELIWADLQVRRSLTYNEITGTQSYLAQVVQVLTSGFRPELLDAVVLRTAGSTVVATPEEADVLFVVESPDTVSQGVQVVTPFNAEKIAEMLL